MDRKPERRDQRYTKADHRPMVPELRGPSDPLDFTVRELRHRYEDVIPNPKQMWR